jgi:nucleoside-diphosphate-sugar epimerase
VAGERLLDGLIRERHVPVSIVRPGWIYGPRDTGSFARFARLLETGKMIMFGPGSNYLPLVHARDVAQGILLASEAPQAVGRAYIIVNDEPVTQSDYLTAIARCLSVAPPTRHLPYRLALLLATVAETGTRMTRRQGPPPVMRYGVQMLGGNNRFMIARARQELGFVPRVALAEGVEASTAWYKSIRDQQGRRNSL